MQQTIRLRGTLGFCQERFESFWGWSFEFLRLFGNRSAKICCVSLRSEILQGCSREIDLGCQTSS